MVAGVGAADGRDGVVGILAVVVFGILDAVEQHVGVGADAFGDGVPVHLAQAVVLQLVGCLQCAERLLA